MWDVMDKLQRGEPAFCDVCHQPLFEAEPGVTTKEQIRKFVENSVYRSKRDEENDWIHPGIYCPNGCFAVMIQYDDEPLQDRGEGG